MLRIFRSGAGTLMNLAPNDPGWMGVIVSVPYKRGRRSVPVSAAEAHPRYGLGCRAPRVDEPSAANCDPMASNDQKPRLFKFPIGPLALPGCKGRRIAAEISNELQVMTEMAKRML